jgi:nucleoside-diphosphate-sugar epimerase
MPTPDLSGATVLVTGANGFVGGRVCATLAAAGADVRALVRRPGTAPADLDRVTEVVAAYDRTGLSGALAGSTHVVHCAAGVGPDHATAAEVNVVATRLLGELAAAAGVRRLVHVSTTSVVADDVAVIDEQAALVPDDASPYAATKRQGEEALAAVADATGLDLVVLRPPTVQGWAPTSTWGQRIPTMYAEGTMPFRPDPRADMGWVHVDDLADAIVLAAATDDVPSRTYVVGLTTTWGAYLDELAAWYPDAPDPREPADDPPAPRPLDSTRVRTELGWTPRRDFSVGIAEAAPHHG